MAEGIADESVKNRELAAMYVHLALCGVLNEDIVFVKLNTEIEQIQLYPEPTDLMRMREFKDG